MEILITILGIYLALVNIAAFCVYAFDKFQATTNSKGAWWTPKNKRSVKKKRAKQAARRIPEATLIMLAAIGGALGAWLAMQLFRHKTRHKKFKILVPLLLLVWAIALGYLYEIYYS